MDVKPGYKQTEVGVIPEDWRVIDISDLCILQRGYDITDESRRSGTIPVYSSSGIAYYHDTAIASPPGVVTGRKGALGQVFLVSEPFWPHDTTLWVKDFKGNYPAYVALVLQRFHLERLDAATSVPTLNRNNLIGYPIPIPSAVKEQRAIAEALSDADALIESLDELIAKKRQIKQGAMQQLLTGKIRLPGFSGEWEVSVLGQIAVVNKGVQLPRTASTELGHFAHMNGGVGPSGYSNYANALGDTIVVSEGGNSCGFVQVISESFWCGGHCYIVEPAGIDKRFLYHALKAKQTSIMGLRVGSGLPNVQKSALVGFQVRYPKDWEEQRSIATVLSDMDEEIEALEARRDKAKAIKQGMMQSLLTGQVRLVEPEQQVGAQVGV